jgi:pilus assembly protein CpaE
LGSLAAKALGFGSKKEGFALREASQEHAMNTAKSRTINVSVLYGTGIQDPGYREVLQTIDNLRLLHEAKDPETFWAQQQEEPPDLVLVDLNGSGLVPDWLASLIKRLPKSEVMVCSHSRDVDFILRIMKLRPGGFLPLPLNREEVRSTLKLVQSRLREESGSPRCQILAVTGTKGGVGTTSVATNLAVALTESNAGKVVLVDLARPFPHVGQFLDLKCEHTIKDLMAGADALDPLFLKKIVQRHKSKLEVLLSYPDYHLNSKEPPDFNAMCKIFAALRASYQWVVVDLGSWLDMFYLRVLQKADQALLVTELTLPDLQNAKVIKSLFLDWDLDGHKVKVLANHFAKHYALGLKNLESIFTDSTFYTLPHDYHPLMEAINQGEPLAEVAPRSRLWRSLKEIAAELVGQNQAEGERQVEAGSGLLRKIFSR